MSIRLESIGFRNPSLSLRAASSMALCHAPTPASLSLGFEALFRAKLHCRASTPMLPRVIGLNLQLRHTNLRNRSLFSFAASHEESKSSDIDIDNEKEDLKAGAQESEEAWQQTLAAFKEQALKMQGISKEAYDQYSAKAMIVLKEYSEKLKIQAEKARKDLSVLAKEIAEESKGYLATATQNSPEEVKDIVETFTSSADEFKDVSKVRDFYVGIPYGGLLTLGGFLSFMFTGSVPAIRFGIVLGGALLVLSISSLKTWKKGQELSPLVIKGQTAIATILFLRELRLLSMRPFIANFVTTFVSGGVVAFYLYRIITDRTQSGGPNMELGSEH